MRVLLIHIVNPDRYQIERDQYFPFLQAALMEGKVPVRRVFLGLPAPARCGEGRLVFDVPGEDLVSLLRFVEEWRPDRLVFNERIDDGAFRAVLEAAGPAARAILANNSWVRLRLDLLDRLRLPAGVLGPARIPLEQRIAPSCAGEPLNEMATAVRPLIRLLLGRTCSYLTPLVENPFFRDMDLGEHEGHKGCSFCASCREEGRNPPAAKVVGLALTQLEAAAATLNPRVQDREFLVRGTTVLGKMDELAEAMSVRELPPCVLHLSSRLDEISRAAAVLHEALPKLRARGHRLVLWNVGIENFSPAENLRFNKGLEPDAIEAGLAEIDRLETTHPDAFDSPGFGFILFTPWTRIEDLRTNIRVARALGHEELFSQACIGTALQLLDDRPITKLAMADGLVAPAYEDRALDSGCVTSWTDAEMPWRFADPLVGRVFYLARRYGPHGDVPDDDPFVSVVREFRRQASASRGREIDPLLALEAIMDAVESAPDCADPSRTLERALKLLGAGGAAGRFDDAGSDSEASAAEEWSRAARMIEERLNRGRRSAEAPGLKVALVGEGADPRVEISLDDGDLRVVVERARAERRYFDAREGLGVYYRARERPVGPTEISVMRSLLDAAIRAFEARES